MVTASRYRNQVQAVLEASNWTDEQRMEDKVCCKRALGWRERQASNSNSTSPTSDLGSDFDFNCDCPR